MKKPQKFFFSVSNLTEIVKKSRFIEDFVCLIHAVSFCSQFFVADIQLPPALCCSHVLHESEKLFCSAV